MSAIARSVLVLSNFGTCVVMLQIADDHLPHSDGSFAALISLLPFQNMISKSAFIWIIAREAIRTQMVCSRLSPVTT